MIVGRRYRLYPSDDAATTLSQWCGSARFVWNLALEHRQTAWQFGARVSLAEQCRGLTEARAAFRWLAEFPAQAAQQVLRNLDTAYRRWWAKTSRRPTWKKKGGRESLNLPGQAVAVRRIARRWGEVRLPKLGWIRFRWARPLGGVVRNCTISRNALGWHVSFMVETSAGEAPPNGKPGVGVDFGVRHAAWFSDEDHPRDMAASLTVSEKRRLLGLQHRLARQARRRSDFTHKLTTDLVKNHGWVAVEALSVKALTTSARGTAERPGSNIRQKAGLNRSILDNSPYERIRQLAYKAPREGSELRLVPAPWTSQRHHLCGQLGVRDKERFWCPSCRIEEHADANASRNIEAAGRAVGPARITPARAGRVNHSTAVRRMTAPAENPPPFTPVERTSRQDHPLFNQGDRLA